MAPTALAAASAATVIADAPGPAAEAATPVVYTFPVIHDAPTLMPGLPAGVTQVATGIGGNFGLALLPGGTVSAWGLDASDNSDGQLGDSTTTDRLTPVRIPGPTAMIQVAGEDYSLGLRSDGTVWVWATTTPASSAAAPPPTASAPCRYRA